MDLSLVVITRNEERDLPRCLSSVPFAREIIVVDSGSDDATVDVATSLGARVYHHDFVGFGDQKQWALERATCEIVLSLDADESLEDGMAAAIRGALENDLMTGGGDGPAGFRLPRRIFYMGRLMRFGPWSRDMPLRLFRRDSARFTDDPVHERVVLLDGARPTVLDGGWIRHEPYDDFADNLARMATYARTWAEMRSRAGRRAGLLQVLTRPAWRFLRGYVFMGGFLEGFPGLAASVGSAMYAFAKWSMLRRMSMRRAGLSVRS